jgi:chromosome partitioning protein
MAYRRKIDDWSAHAKMGNTSVKSVLALGAQHCEHVQRRIIEIQNQPDQTKQLRLFPTTGAAEILGLSDSHFRALVRDRQDFPKGQIVGGNNHRAFRLAEIHEILRILSTETDDLRYLRGRRGSEAVQVIAVANFKGGAAKTTTAINLAQYLALRGYRVLLIDLDSQGSLTSMFGLQPDLDVEAKDTLYPLFRGEIPTIEGLPRPTHWPGLDLIPASLALYQSEFELPVRKQREPGLEFWRVLEHGIRDARVPYDVIICDSPPSLGFMTINALFAATGVLVPVPPSMVDFASTGSFFRMSHDVLEQIEQYDPKGKHFDFFKVLVTKFKTDDQNHIQVSRLMAVNFGEMMLEHKMASTTMIDAASLRKQTFYEIDASIGRQTYRRGLRFLNELNFEIEGLIWKAWGRASLPPAMTLAA